MPYKLASAVQMKSASPPTSNTRRPDMPWSLDYGGPLHDVVFLKEVSTTNNDHPHHLQVVALVLTIYDHFLTFDRELDYIWLKAEWSISSGLYLVTRYGGDLLAIGSTVVYLHQHATPSFCNIGLKVVGAGSMIVILFAQVVMQLRVKTLYRSSMSKIINVIWALEIAAAIGLGVSTTFSITIISLEVNSGHMCAVKHFPSYAAAFWLPILVFEFFLFALAFRVAWYNHQQLGNWRGAALLHVVLRDNFNFFFLALFSYLVTGIAWLTVGAQYFLVTGQLSCALTTIMSCRFILNLYQAYHKPFRASTDSSHTRSIWAMSAIICGVHFLDLPASESSPSRASIAEQACQVTGAIAEQNEGGELEQG